MDLKVNENTVVVFDLDDTLYNELDFLKSAYVELAQSLEPNNWKSLYSRMFSLYRCRINVFEFLSDTYAIDVQSMVEMYRNHQPKIKLFDGVIDVIKAIKSKSGRVGLITDGRSVTQRNKLKSLGLISCLDKIIISEELGSEKPSLVNFKAIEQALPASEYIYIADNLKKDFIAPNLLGWNSIGLIDNGKNIHFESHAYIDSKYLPQGFVLGFEDITIR